MQLILLLCKWFLTYYFSCRPKAMCCLFASTKYSSLILSVCVSSLILQNQKENETVGSIADYIDAAYV